MFWSDYSQIGGLCINLKVYIQQHKSRLSVSRSSLKDRKKPETELDRDRFRLDRGLGLSRVRGGSVSVFLIF
jgi:hypothetical protein